MPTLSSALSGLRTDGNVDELSKRRSGEEMSRENWPVTGRQPPRPKVAGTAAVAVAASVGWTRRRDGCGLDAGMTSVDSMDGRFRSGLVGALYMRHGPNSRWNWSIVNLRTLPDGGGSSKTGDAAPSRGLIGRGEPRISSLVGPGGRSSSACPGVRLTTHRLFHVRHSDGYVGTAAWLSGIVPAENGVSLGDCVATSKVRSHCRFVSLVYTTEVVKLILSLFWLFPLTSTSMLCGKLSWLLVKCLHYLRQRRVNVAWRTKAVWRTDALYLSRQADSVIINSYSTTLVRAFDARLTLMRDVASSFDVARRRNADATRRWKRCLILSSCGLWDVTLTIWTYAF